MFPVIDSAASCPDHGPQDGMAEALPPPKGVAKAAYSSVESLLTHRPRNRQSGALHNTCPRAWPANGSGGVPRRGPTAKARGKKLS